MLRVVVPIKQVSILDEDFELETGSVAVDPDFVELALNDWDSFSVEAALQIREQAGDGEAEVIVVTVGGGDAEEALQACLAMGADRAIRIWDETAFADPDPLAVATALAPAVRDVHPDLVLCGVQSADAASGATGIALAGLLGVAHTAVARSIDCQPSERMVLVDRELEGGTVEQVAVPMPAVLTIQTGINEPRYATLRAIKQAATKPMERLTLEDIGLNASMVHQARGGRSVALSVPSKEGPHAEMIDGDPEAVARAILTIVQESLTNGAAS
jgi:electron transfer flavoprotein beta subunit